MTSIVFQKKHVASTAQEEEQQKDCVNWDIWKY